MTVAAPARIKAPADPAALFAPAQGRRLSDCGAFSSEQNVSSIQEMTQRSSSCSASEPRIGHDFGRIPIHPVDVRIAPASNGLIQRKLATKAPVDSYLTSQGVSGYSKSGGVYSGTKRFALGLERVILYDLLSSDRRFTIAGATTATAQASLGSHVNARKGVVKSALDLKNKITWGVGSRMRMNPKYWVRARGGWEAKQGVTTVEAARDVFSNPSRFPYAMACHAAAGVAMVAGSGSASYKEFGSGVAETDWVPGEWGYIKNKAHRDGVSPEGHEGQNLIYVGFSQFWGHPAGLKTMAGWTRHVRGFDSGKGDPETADWRRIPSAGIA